MRIQTDIDDLNFDREAFSQDILKIEISGPDVSQSQPTWGIRNFRLILTSKLISQLLMYPAYSGLRPLVSTYDPMMNSFITAGMLTLLGLTTESDVTLIRNIVKYMGNRRTM